MAKEIVARRVALAQGLITYFTGKPCKRGHVDRRWTSNGTCCECLRMLLRDRYANDPAPARKRARDYANLNRERLAERERDYYRENPHKRREKEIRWRKANPDQHGLHVKVGAANRRARKKKADGRYETADLVAILKAQNHCCAYCCTDLRKAKRHVDHIQPLSCGGSNDRTNLQYLCAPCNLSKGAKDPILFAQELGRLL